MSSYLPLIVLCSALTAYLAHSKSRNPIAWFFIGLVTGPIGVVIVLALREK